MWLSPSNFIYQLITKKEGTLLSKNPSHLLPITPSTTSIYTPTIAHKLDVIKANQLPVNLTAISSKRKSFQFNKSTPRNRYQTPTNLTKMCTKDRKYYGCKHYQDSNQQLCSTWWEHVYTITVLKAGPKCPACRTRQAEEFRQSTGYPKTKYPLNWEERMKR